MKKITVRYTALLIMMLIIALNAAVPISAAGYLDTTVPASLTVNFCPDGISAADIRFELFKVADVDEYTGLTLTQNFSDIPIDLSSPDSGVWAKAVAEAESCISSNGLSADYSALSDENGTAVFSDLPVGLYLLRGESFVMDHDVYKPQAYLIMLPNRSNNGSWEYDVTSVPKYEKSDELIDIRVMKKWEGGNADTRPAEITVILYCDDSEYESVILNDDNDWQYTWSALNAKNNWTVSEISVEGYTTLIDNDGYSYVITNEYIIPPEEPDTPPDDPGGDLPQTGVIWWHIPMIAGAGIICCLAGLMMKKRSKSA